MTIDDFRAAMEKLISDALHKLHPADLLSVLEDEAISLQSEIENRAERKWPYSERRRAIAERPTEWYALLASRSDAMPDGHACDLEAAAHAAAAEAGAIKPCPARQRDERPRHRRAAKQRDELGAPHSITSSARARSPSGISRPSAFAVLRLITSSCLVGACTGRSDGFSPLRIRST
jgi:hypothetical protein